MRHLLGKLATTTVIVTGAALGAILPAPAPHAATTYIWVQGYHGDGTPIPGADHVNWSDPENWSPQGVPANGDAVVLPNAPFASATTLTVPPGITLDSFTMSSNGAGNVYLIGAPLTVTGDFDWTGGYIGVPVEIAGNGRVGAGSLKALSFLSGSLGRLVVTGNLLLDDLGNSDTQYLSMAPDDEGSSDGISVAATGTLRAVGTNLVTSTHCCTDPARVAVDGAIVVESGTTTISAAELDLHGVAAIALGATLRSTVGPARLGAGARYLGGGTLDFTETAAIRSAPDQQEVPGGILMEGVGKLSNNTRIHFGQSAKLTGVGGFSGPGVIDVSSPNNPGNASAHIYGDLTVGAGTLLSLGGAVPSRLEVFSPGLSGYHGVLRIKGTASLAARSTFVTQGGTLTSITKTGTLSLAPRSVWGEGDCCGDPAALINKGTLVVPAGAGNARVTWTDLRTTGTLRLAAGRRLVTAGYPVRVGGTLKLTGRSKPGAQRTVLTGQQIKGRFACIAPNRQVATYTAKAVRVTGVVGKSGKCLGAKAGKSIGKKKIAKSKTARFTATKGVPKKAKKVLVAVTVTKAPKATRIKVGGAPAFKVGKGSTTRYVIAQRISKKFVTIRNNGKGAITVKVVLLGAA